MGCKEAFCEVEQTDHHFKSINFIKEDWDEATLMYNGWKVLKELRKDFDNLVDAAYKTANVYFPMICNIFLRLVHLEKSDNDYILCVASVFRKYFDRFWNNSNLVLLIAVILDPRFKMDIVKHFYKEIYGNDSNTHLKKIIDEVTNIYKKYAGSTNNGIATSELEFYQDSKCPPGEAFNILEW
ncbi:hypothetical protein Pint_25839 [Pistacia integerrima]|uniref:Uncharacterized protein n=1 Tax=Pistacia integerrima TaxID=434235 RepID=A0ACC0YAZ5_9ROSI|nr:hypothetical protein Pint_25839 [Pistacia integerrima]